MTDQGQEMSSPAEQGESPFRHDRSKKKCFCPRTPISFLRHTALFVLFVVVGGLTVIILTEVLLIKNYQYTNNLAHWPSVTCTVTDEQSETYWSGSHVSVRDIYYVVYQIDGALYNSSSQYVDGLNYAIGDQVACVYNAAEYSEVYFTDFLNSMSSDYFRAMVMYPLILLAIYGGLFVCSLPCYWWRSTNNAVEYSMPLTPSSTIDCSAVASSDIPKEVITFAARYLSVFEGSSETILGAKIFSSRFLKAIRIIFRCFGVLMLAVGMLDGLVLLSMWRAVFVSAFLYLYLGLMTLVPLTGLAAGGWMMLLFARFITAPCVFVTRDQGFVIKPNVGLLCGGPKYLVTSFTWDEGVLRAVPAPRSGAVMVYYGNVLLGGVRTQHEFEEFQQWLGTLVSVCDITVNI